MRKVPGAQTYSSYFKCRLRRQMICPVNECHKG